MHKCEPNICLQKWSKQLFATLILAKNASFFVNVFPLINRRFVWRPSCLPFSEVAERKIAFDIILGKEFWSVKRGKERLYKVWLKVKMISINYFIKLLLLLLMSKFLLFTFFWSPQKRRGGFVCPLKTWLY